MQRARDDPPRSAPSWYTHRKCLSRTSRPPRPPARSASRWTRSGAGTGPGRSGSSVTPRTGGSCRHRRSRGWAGREGSEQLSARNRFRGVVRSVDGRGSPRPDRDRRDRAGSRRRDHHPRLRRAARVEAGDERRRSRQGDIGHGRAMRRVALVRRKPRRRRRSRRGQRRVPDRPHADRPIVLAAASLTEVLPRIEPDGRYSFAGSNQLAQQIRPGAPFDVFLSASPVYTQELYREGFVRKPVAFATNSLVHHRPPLEPAEDPDGVRPREAPEAQARGRRPEGPDRALHPRGPEAARAAEGADGRRSASSRTSRASSARSHWARPTRASSIAPTSRPVSGKVVVVGLPRRSQPTVGTRRAIAVEPESVESAQAFVIALLSAGRAAGASSSGVRPPVSSRAFAVAPLGVAAVVALVPAAPRRSRCSCECPPESSSTQLSSDVVRDALAVTIKTNLVALALILGLGHADGVPDRHAVVPRPGCSCSRSSSCRWFFPPRSPASACSPRSAVSACSADELDVARPQSRAFTQTAVVLAVAFVAGPFYVRPAIAAFESVDPDLTAAAPDAGRRAGTDVPARRAPAGRWWTGGRRGAGLRAGSR